MNGPPSNILGECKKHIPNSKHPYSSIQECSICGRFRVIGITVWEYWDRKTLNKKKKEHDTNW